MNGTNQSIVRLTEDEAYLDLKGNILIVTKTVPIILVTVGTIVNILTLITVTSPKTKKSSFIVYLGGLAVVDTVLLFMWPFDYWLEAMFNFKMERTSNFMCKFRFVANLVCQSVSAWLIVALTVERTFCTYFPLKFKIVCRPRVGVIAVAVISTTMFVMYSHTFYGFTLVQKEGVAICGFVSPGYAIIFRRVISWAHVTTSYFLPATIIIVANTATVLRVYRSGKVISTALSEVNKKRVRHITAVTLLVSTSFILLVGPFSFWIIVRAFVFPNNLNFAQRATSQVEQIAQIVTHSIVHMNHAVNFFLYVLSGERFRKDLRAAVPCFPFRPKLGLLQRGSSS